MPSTETWNWSVVLPTLADIAFFVVGVFVVVLALTRKPLAARQPIDWSHPKLGHLRMDFLAFLVVVGTAIASVGLFFRYRGYEARLLEAAATKSETDIRLRQLPLQID